MTLGVVGGAHEGAALDVAQALLQTEGTQTSELLRVDVLHDGQVAARRLQVLPDGHNRHADSVGIVDELEDFLLRLAEAEHDTRLSGDAALGDTLQHREALVVGRYVAHRGRETADGLEVVRDDLGLTSDDLVDVVQTAVEVGDEDLDSDLRCRAADSFDGTYPVPCAVVLEVVAVDAGDDGVLQAHLLDALCHLHRLEGIEWCGGFPREGVTEAAGARTDSASDHEGRCASAPALPLVGAAAAVADGIEPVVLDRMLCIGEGRVVAEADLQPLGLADAHDVAGLLLGDRFFLHHISDSP